MQVSSQIMHWLYMIFNYALSLLLHVSLVILNLFDYKNCVMMMLN